MTGMDFDCECCGEHQEDTGTPGTPWPALGFRRPDPYLALDEHGQRHHARATDDLCVIHGPDRSEHFVRGLLSIPIIGERRTLEYGPWISVSEVGFADYLHHYELPEHREHYAGHLATGIPGYRNCFAVPVQVITQGLVRPQIVPDSTFGHPLVRDFYDGIPRQEAELRIRSLLLPEVA